MTLLTHLGYRDALDEAEKAEKELAKIVKEYEQAKADGRHDVGHLAAQAQELNDTARAYRRAAAGSVWSARSEAASALKADASVRQKIASALEAGAKRLVPEIAVELVFKEARHDRISVPEVDANVEALVAKARDYLKYGWVEVDDLPASLRGLVGGE